RMQFEEALLGRTRWGVVSPRWGVVSPRWGVVSPRWGVVSRPRPNAIPFIEAAEETQLGDSHRPGTAVQDDVESHRLPRIVVRRDDQPVRLHGAVHRRDKGAGDFPSPCRPGMLAALQRRDALPGPCQRLL